MAKLYFYYASMNAGKSTALLQADFNYRERGMRTRLFTAGVDTRHGEGVIASRVSLSQPASTFTADTDLFAAIAPDVDAAPLACVLVDEAQFLSAAQVDQLAQVADLLGVPVLAYGLRTDFLGELFSGSARLLAVADVLSEIKSVCLCGRKATFTARIAAGGRAAQGGAQTEIGGNDRYVALCRRHHREALAGTLVLA